MAPPFAALLKQKFRLRYVAFLLIAIAALAVGLAWGGYLPASWKQAVQNTSDQSLTWLTQAPLPAGIRTKISALISRSDAPTNSVAATSQTVVPVENRAGTPESAALVTVITMTPTPDLGEASPAAPLQSPTPAFPGEGSLASDPLQQMPAYSAGEATGYQSLESLRIEIYTVYQNMLSTLALMETLRQGQPTEKELAELHGRVEQISQQVALLTVKFEAAQPQIFLLQMEQMAAKMQMMQSLLANQTASTPPLTAAPLDPANPTPAAPAPGAASQDPADPHAHANGSGDPSTAAGNGMSDMMSGMPCMGSAASQASGSNPIQPSGSLSKTIMVGDVTLSVTPLNLRDSSAVSLDFYIVLDSPTTDIDPHLPQMARLLLPDGMEYSAIRWVGPQGGKHLEGTLSFSRRDGNGLPLAIPLDGSLALILDNISGLAEDAFTWDLSTIN